MSLPTPATPPTPGPNRYLVRGAEIVGREVAQLCVDLVAIGPFTYADIAPFVGGGPVVIAKQPTHPTRTVTAKVTCVLLDDETTIGHPKYEITLEAERYQSWRFVVADAAPYPVGSTITLEVPA